MNDLKPFKHGDEGTHAICNKHMAELGWKAGCCECAGKTDCEDLSPKKEGWQKALENLALTADPTQPIFNLPQLKGFIHRLLASQKEEILAMIEKQRMVWPKMGQEYTLNALKAKIELI